MITTNHSPTCVASDPEWPREDAPPARRIGHSLLTGCRRFGWKLWPFTPPAPPDFGNEPRAAENEEDPGPTAGQWADRLGEEKGFLLALVGDIGTEFLSTGEGLSQLAQHLSKIQAECQSLTDQTLGRAEDAGVQFAFQLLKKAEDLVLAGYEQYDHVFATFAELQQHLGQLSKQHDKLMRILLPLNLITIAFRIEASRHPSEVQQTFLTLADNVNRTVDEVRSTMAQQFGDLAASERIAQSLMERISAAIRQDRKEVTATLEASRQHLSGLNAALTNSGAGATELAEINQAVNRHIGTIVMAQQCQDITRQKIEHVGEALDEMRDHLEETQDGEADEAAMTRQFISQAAQIQLLQVHHVFDELHAAADGLRSGMQSLRSGSGAAAEVAVKVGSAALDTKAAGQCQDGVGDLLTIIQQTVQRVAEILAAFDPLQASFMDCTSKATDLAIDVRHAALNAQIFAIQAPDGAALGVLSGRVRVVADEAIEQIGKMGVALQQTIELVGNLQERLGDFRELGQAEQEVLTEESALTMNKLAGLEEAIPVLIQRILQQQGGFAREVEKLLANVQFPRTVADASARALGFFDELLQWGADGNADTVLDAVASRKIDLLQAKYTMDSERRAHAAAVQSAGAADSSFDLGERGEPVSATAAPSDDLGDNIELF